MKITIERVYKAGKSYGVVYTVDGRRCSTFVGKNEDAQTLRLKRDYSDRGHQSTGKSGRAAVRNLTQLIERALWVPADKAAATARQKEFVYDLIARAGGLQGTHAHDLLQRREDVEDLSKAAASRVIDLLKVDLGWAA